MLLVASHLRGICSVSLGSDETLLIRSLRTKFPRHQTAFSKFVPSRSSYALRALSSWGNSDIQRCCLTCRNNTTEVGEACSRNRIAFLIPCHRIIRSDGSLADYRWGIDRKKMLLSVKEKPHPILTPFSLLLRCRRGNRPCSSDDLSSTQHISTSCNVRMGDNPDEWPQLRS